MSIWCFTEWTFVFGGLMKKFVVVLVMVCFAISSAFAWQENYRQSSDEVQTFYVLRRLSGTSTAEPMFPITSSQLLSMVKSLDTSRFGSVAMEMYDDLVERLSSPSVLLSIDDMGFDFDMPILMYQNSKTSDPYYYTLADRPNLLALKLTFNLTPHFTTLFDLNFAKGDQYLEPTDTIFILPKAYRNQEMGLMIPDVAYGSLGTDTLNLTVGRDRISSGMGFTGNLGFGDNFIYDDYMKFSFVKGKVSYDMTMVTYDDAQTGHIDFNNDRKNTVNHRLTFTVGDLVTLTGFEGAVIYTDSVIDDPRYLNPFMLIHNYYTFESGNTNNFFGVDVAINTKFGLSANGQIYFDQIMNSFETEESGVNAMAYLANVAYTKELKHGILSLYAEDVYTSLNCYLKESDPFYGIPGQMYSNEQVDMIMQLTGVWWLMDKVNLGYKYGTDVNAYAAGASYMFKGNTISADFYYLSKGPFGAGENEERSCDGHPLAEYNNRTQLIRFDVGVKGKVHDCISYDASFGWNIIKNINHVLGTGYCGPEFKIGFIVDPAGLIPRHPL